MSDPKHIERVTWLQLLIATVLLAIMILSMRACAPVAPDAPDVEVNVTVVTTSTSTATDTGTATDCGEGLALGDTKEVACQEGDGGKLYKCTATGLVLERDDCNVGTGTGTDPGTPAACKDVTTFDELQPVLALACAGCHPGRDTYDQAKAKFPVMLARITSAKTAPGHMPPGKQLPDNQAALFGAWEAGGFLKAGECEADGDDDDDDDDATGFVTFGALEVSAFADATAASEADRPDLAYLSFADRIDAGAGAEELAAWKAAAAKALAHVSVARDTFPPVEISPGLLRINVRDLQIDGAKWEAIEDASILNFESFTGTGEALKLLTRKRLPIMHVSEFMDAALRNGSVYYKLTEAPATAPLLFKKLGVNYAEDLLAGRATLVGFNGSRLSPAANRLISRHESDDGFLYGTYDTGPIVSDAQNVFKKPLLKEAGGQANLKFAASEFIYTLPNGSLGFFLADAAGRRLDFADPAVVHDFTSNPVSPFIRAGVSCLQCHSGGIIGHTDEVLAKVTGPSGQLDAADAQIVRALFKPQARVDAQIAADNVRYSDTMKRLSVDTTQPDPVTRTLYAFLGDLTRRDVGGLFYLTEPLFAQCLAISEEGREECGQATCSHDQLALVADQIARDCLIFRDQLGGAQ